MPAITAENLSKNYGGVQALKGVSFSIEQGEIFGFLGPNGAGKTTAVKLLTGMLEPTGGACTVLNVNPAQSPGRLHELVGVVTEHAQMYDYMTGLQNLTFYGSLFGLPADTVRTRAISLLDRLNLTEALNRKLSSYSTGMRQRLSLARAMIHKPQTLFLDEPTSGLDPESTLSVNSLIKSLAQNDGTTVFLCTHQLRYAQEICTDYGLLDKGILLASGNIGRLREQAFTGFTVRVKASRFPNDPRFSAASGGYCDIRIHTEADIPPLVKELINAGSDIYEVTPHQPTLEEIYFALIDAAKSKEAHS
jgi:ABC-2 type transport system ATP-binding protein